MEDQTCEFKHGGIHKYVQEYVDSLPDLTGKVVVDIPCGDGRASYAFRKRGATVRAFDLFPEFMKIDGIDAQFADLSERLPVDDASADFVICQEGIEHIPDKVRMFREFNRVLKKGGTLVFTAPSISHARGRLSWFLFETDLWRRMPPSELDSVWVTEGGSDRTYFGHLFLIGVHHLQTICTLTGFSVLERRKTKTSGLSVFLGILFYPLLAIMSLVAYQSYKKKIGHVDPAKRDEIFWQRVKLNLSPRTMFCRHLFWVLRKEQEISEAHEDIRQLTRGV